MTLDDINLDVLSASRKLVINSFTNNDDMRFVRTLAVALQRILKFIDHR